MIREEVEGCEMQEVVVTSTQLKKNGNSPEVLFMGLEAPFELRSMAGGEIAQITVENRYHQDGWEKTGEGQSQLVRRGTFTITVKAIVPQGEPIAGNGESRCA